jgi:hypothetical protein
VWPGLRHRAVELEPHTDLVTMMRPSTQRAVFLGHAGMIARAVPAIAACAATAEQQGDQSARPHLLRTLAWMELGAGQLDDAAVHIGQAMALADELALNDAYIWAVAGQIDAARGAASSAHRLCELACDRARETGNPWAEIRALGATGFLALTEDRPADAAASLTAADAIAVAANLIEIGWHRMHGDLVEALVANGQLIQASAAARSFSDRAIATGHPWSLAVSARSRGLVAAAAGEVDTPAAS